MQGLPFGLQRLPCGLQRMPFDCTLWQASLMCAVLLGPCYAASAQVMYVKCYLTVINSSESSSECVVSESVLKSLGHNTPQGITCKHLKM